MSNCVQCDSVFFVIIKQLIVLVSVMSRLIINLDLGKCYQLQPSASADFYTFAYPVIIYNLFVCLVLVCYCSSTR